MPFWILAESSLDKYLFIHITFHQPKGLDFRVISITSLTPINPSKPQSNTGRRVRMGKGWAGGFAGLLVVDLDMV
jgi:hypothetical protein